MDEHSKDLDSLLDDALGDFDKPIFNNSTNTSSSSVKDKEVNEPNKPSLVAPPIDVFNAFFDGAIAEKLQEEWNSAMQELSDEDPELQKHLLSMSNMGETSSSNNAKNCKSEQSKKKENDIGEVNAKVKEAIESLAKCAEEEHPDVKMFKNFLKLGLDEDGDEDSLPGFGMMEDMMKMMLSRDMLYQPMLDMKNNFPTWLQKNKESLSDSDIQNYEKQIVCIEKICSEFEAESDSDSNLVKSTRLSTIMNIVTEMQKYGQPPPSLVSDHNPSQDNCLIS